MKKAILITGIIFLVLCIGAAIAEISVGVSDLMTKTQGPATVDAAPGLGVANIIIGVSFIVGAILDIIILVKRNSNMSKKAGICLGVFAAIFGAVAPGIIFAIDSGMHRE